MEALIKKYADKLVRAGVADPGAPLMGGVDAEIVWNRPDPACAVLEKVFGGISVNALLFSRAAEPYRSIIDYLAEHADAAIHPRDCETRTFFHDLPLQRNFTADEIIRALKKRKCVIIPGKGIVAFGTVSPEQAFITFSSVCFACFVKFFSDYLADSKKGRVNDRQRRVFEAALPLLDAFPDACPALMKGPFASERDTFKAVSEAGRLTVTHRLVDSFFGNVSCRFGNTLCISQTGSSLDELEGNMDPVPLDGSATTGITASSELTAHREVILNTGNNAVLHGHPKFSVIISMDCDKEDRCETAGQCHVKCPEKRFVRDIPIVPGEVGTGPRGLARTMPPAMKGRRGVIVYGHGVFTVGKDDFRPAFENLLQIEKMCREEYFSRLKQ